MPSPSPAERGSVTAEFAAVTPAIVLVLAICLAAAQLVVQQVRVHDAAWQAVRAQTRGDPLPALLDELGAQLRFAQRDRTLCAEVEAPAVGMLAVFHALRLRASSCAPAQRL